MRLQPAVSLAFVPRCLRKWNADLAQIECSHEFADWLLEVPTVRLEAARDPRKGRASAFHQDRASKRGTGPADHISPEADASSFRPTGSARYPNSGCSIGGYRLSAPGVKRKEESLEKLCRVDWFADGRCRSTHGFLPCGERCRPERGMWRDAAAHHDANIHRFCPPLHGAIVRNGQAPLCETPTHLQLQRSERWTLRLEVKLIYAAIK